MPIRMTNLKFNRVIAASGDRIEVRFTTAEAEGPFLTNVRYHGTGLDNMFGCRRFGEKEYNLTDHTAKLATRAGVRLQEHVVTWTEILISQQVDPVPSPNRVPHRSQTVVPVMKKQDREFDIET